MIKLLLLLFTHPAKILNLITADNFRRLWFCISTMQFSLISDRIKEIHKIDSNHAAIMPCIFKARDRGVGEKTLLFIDRHVPFYDQDAGSRSTLQYLQLMVEMGYNIKFLGNDFIYYQPYTSRLQQIGIEVLYGTGYRNGWKRWIIENKNNIDYIYLSRPHIARNYLGFLKKYTSCKLIYCGHDLNYLREMRRHLIEGDRSSLLASRKWEKMELDIIRNVDVSYFFSSFELKELQKRLPDSTVRTIPLFLFDKNALEQKNQSDFESRSGILFVGGFNHPPNIDAVQWFVRDIFPQVRYKLPEIELIIVGANPPVEIARLSGNGVTVANKISDEELERQYLSRRLVIAPLRYGAGVKGKIVEAMQYGLPTITTSIGAEGINEAELALFIADEAQIFADTLIRVYTDTNLWNNASAQMTATVKKNFSKAAAREILCRDMPPA